MKKKSLIINFLYQVTDISGDGFVEMMDDNGETRQDIKVPDSDVGKDLKERFDKGDSIMATLLSACDEEMIVGVKQARD